ncbi:Fc.00g059730.m01.CDS01 [Cosmosporella sp. VM-42]
MENERRDFLMNRPRHPTDEAAVFVENRVGIPGEQAPVFVDRLNQVEYLEEAIKQKNISNELWKQANDEKDKLFTLMEQVRAQLDKKATNSIQPANLDLRRCTWNQVMQEVQNTASRWSTTPKKTSKMMVCLDRLGRNSNAFQSWLQLLPGGDYGSSICGVFALAIGAVGHYSKVEDAVLETLAQIPEIIDNARRYIDLYSKSRDQRLESRTFDLYLSILKALTHVMRFFADSSLRKIYQPLITQSTYKSELLASLENIRAQAARVKEEANQCMQRRLMDIDQSILTQGNILLDTNQSSAQALQILQSIHRFLVNSTISHSSTEGASSRAIKSEHSSPLLGSSEDIERLPPPTGNGSNLIQSELRTKELMDLIQFDPDIISRDIYMCLRLGDALDEKSKTKAANLIQNKTFKTYMTSNPLSEPLLVNGNEDLSCAEGLSPLSLVAARLAQISRQIESTFVVAYFCSEHRPYGSDSTTPAVICMMESLIGQLITHFLEKGLPIDLSFLDEQHWKNLKNLKLKTLCTTFEGLANQVPPGNILFCILDEVSLYETGLIRRDTDAVLRRLTRLTRSKNAIIFKVIATCRGRMLDSSQYFAGHILNMEDSVEVEDSSTWQIANMSI